MIQFKEINGQLCLMLEQPIPLTEDAKFPCVVRLIQDDSQMGKYNKRLADGGRLPFVCNGIKENHIQKDGKSPYFEYAYECYETIGYPVVHNSAEWALYRMMQGDMGCQKDSDFKRYYKNGNVRWLDRAGKERSLTIDLFLKNFSDTSGWQLYEPKQGPCPACNGTGVVMHESANAATQTPLPVSDATQFKVGDWVECNGNQRLIEVIGRDLGRGNYYHFAHGFGGAYANSITRKLSPAEVVIPVQLIGTVRKGLANSTIFHLVYGKGECDYSIIDCNHLVPTTRELVESLLKEQEES